MVSRNLNINTACKLFSVGIPFVPAFAADAVMHLVQFFIKMTSNACSYYGFLVFVPCSLQELYYLHHDAVSR